MSDDITPSQPQRRHVDFGADSMLKRISVVQTGDNKGWCIEVTPSQQVDAARFKMLMDRAHDRMWNMATNRSTAMQRLPEGYAALVPKAPGHMPLLADGSYRTAALPHDKLLHSLTILVGVLSLSIEAGEGAPSTQITRPLLNTHDTHAALDGFGLRDTLASIKESVAPPSHGR